MPRYNEYRDNAEDELKAGGEVEKAQVWALLAIAEAVREVSTIAQVLEDKTLHVMIEGMQDT